MDIKQYNQTMNKININSNEVSTRFFNETIIVNNTPKHKFSYLVNKRTIKLAISLLLIVTLLFGSELLPKSLPEITITAHAEGIHQGTILTEEIMSISTDSKFTIQSSTEMSGSSYFDLTFICEGESINYITYKVSDQIITADNRYNYDAWFVENITSDTYQTLNYELGEYEGTGFNGEYSKIKMIGSSYTIPYVDQTSNSYMLSVNLNIDELGKYNPSPFVVTVMITLENQEIITKELLITPIINSLIDNYQVIDQLDIQLINN